MFRTRPILSSKKIIKQIMKLRSYSHQHVTKHHVRCILNSSFQCDEYTLAGEKGRSLRDLAPSSCYAVLIKMIEGHPHMLCTIRSSKVSLSKGWVVPPGGMIDDGETEIEAAKREAHEEVGLPPDQFEVIGTSKPLPLVFNSNNIQHFYLSWSVFGLVDDNFQPVINEEVEDYFYIPLYMFLDRLETEHSNTEIDFVYGHKVFYHNYTWVHKGTIYKITGAVGHIGLISAIAIYGRRKFIKYGPLIDVNRTNVKYINEWLCYMTVNFLQKYVSSSKL